MNVLDLFSGIGGFSLGLERAGMRTVAFCEIEPFCRNVLAKNFPGIPCYDDVRTLTAERLRADGIAPDVICGGFPCQDISLAGKGAGIDGTRSGLWSEYARIIGEVRPRFVIVENVAALLGRGMERVLGDLATLGYDAEWHCIPASYVGAPHQRDRLWIVAYPASQRPAEARQFCERQTQWIGCRGPLLAYPSGCSKGCAEPRNCREQIEGRRSHESSSSRRCDGMRRREGWSAEPSVCRVVDGISANVDADAALGNAVVPQIPEIIGRAIMKAAA